MSTQAHRYAHQLLNARTGAQLISRISSRQPLSMTDAYDIAKCIADIRVAQGEVPAGRKLGFTNRTIWPKYGIAEPIRAPIWATIFDSTVRYTDDNRGIQSLEGALQPRLEPELVFRLAAAPAPEATLDDLIDCIEWMAHAFEIVVSPFPDWKFEAADAVAAFGLHGSLIIGDPHVLSSVMRRHLAEVLANASLSLSIGGELRAAGFGSNLLDSPVHALWHLHRLLAAQPQFPPLRAGEIVTTGTWTDPYPIQAGETWTTAFSGLGLPGLTMSFV
jgi:2-keto-4-pentenoate hydratase